MASIATTTETVGGGDYRWLKSARGTEHPTSGTLDFSTFSAVDDYPDGYFPSGLPVKFNSGSGLFEACDATSTSDTLAGFVLHDTAVKGSADIVAPIVTDATVDASLVPGDHDLVDGRYFTDEAPGGAS